MQVYQVLADCGKDQFEAVSKRCATLHEALKLRGHMTAKHTAIAIQKPVKRLVIGRYTQLSSGLVRYIEDVKGV